MSRTLSADRCSEGSVRPRPVDLAIVAAVVDDQSVQAGHVDRHCAGRGLARQEVGGVPEVVSEFRPEAVSTKYAGLIAVPVDLAVRLLDVEVVRVRNEFVLARDPARCRWWSP